MAKKQACIIEDALHLSELFSNILEREGLETKVINDGAIALNYLTDNTPDLILLDLNLPEISGIEILDYIRSQGHLKQVKIVVITASLGAALTIEDSVDLVLIKPVTLEQMTSLVKRIIM